MPRQQFINGIDLVLGGAVKNVVKSSLIDAVEFGCFHQRVGDGG
jgi:hypothetical protein